MSHPLHPSIHRKEFSSLTAALQNKLRQLIDTYILTKNPVGEHAAAANDMSLMIHEDGFIAWHNVFIGKLENWLVTNGGREFLPLPYWYPATPIPAALNKNNTQPNIPFPDRLKVGQIQNIPDYTTLNDIMVPYHNTVHNNMGGQMPFAASSPSDPIFYPFHAFLVGVYEHW